MYDGDDCLTWPFGCTKGYGTLWYEGKMNRVARLVCQAAHGAAPSKVHEAAHSCGNGHLACVAKRHLSWKTPAKNAADKLNHGTHPRGERVNGAKLSTDKVRQIIALHGTLSLSEIASKFGIASTTVSAIHRRKIWEWLEE